MAKEQPAIGLLSLPNEIILLILAYTCGEKLDPDLELVCKSIKNLMTSVYRQSYGKGPTPSLPITARCWKDFARRNEEYQHHPAHWASHDIWRFYEYSFLLNAPRAGDNEARATDLIYWLHADPQRHPEGLAIIIAALCQLNRKNEAERFLEQHGKDVISSESKFLLCARFEIDFSVDWAQVPQGCLGKCRQAAAIRGDLDLLHKLRQNPLNVTLGIKDLDDQKAAIRGDSVELLQNLLDIDEGNLGERSWIELIEEAVMFRKVTALQLLLQRVGSHVDFQDAYKNTLYIMDREILNVFKEHSPHLVGSYLPDGQLQIVHTMRVDAYSLTHHQAIEALAEQDSVDINAIGEDGLTALHFAAFKLDTREFALLEKLGADMESPGHIQQTPKEMLSCKDHSGGDDFSSPELFEKKQNLAKKWLSEYMPAVFSGRKGWNFDNYHDLDIKVDSLASFWPKHIGLQTLEELCSLLGKPQYRSIEKLGFIIRTYWYLNQNSNPTTGDSHPLLDIEDIQNRFGKDFGTAIANNLDLHSTAVAERAEPILDPVDIEDILNNFKMDFGTISLQHADRAAVAQYAARILDPVDIHQLRDFVNSDTGRAFRLRPFSMNYGEMLTVGQVERS